LAVDDEDFEFFGRGTRKGGECEDKDAGEGEA
jgi:hypothetical protein